MSLSASAASHCDHYAAARLPGKTTRVPRAKPPHHSLLVSQTQAGGAKELECGELLRIRARKCAVRGSESAASNSETAQTQACSAHSKRPRCECVHSFRGPMRHIAKHMYASPHPCSAGERGCDEQLRNGARMCRAGQRERSGQDTSAHASVQCGEARVRRTFVQRHADACCAGQRERSEQDASDGVRACKRAVRGSEGGRARRIRTRECPLQETNNVVSCCDNLTGGTSHLRVQGNTPSVRRAKTLQHKRKRKRAVRKSSIAASYSVTAQTQVCSAGE